MQRAHLFSLILLISAVNGIFAPFRCTLMYFASFWMPTWALGSKNVLDYASSILCATTTLLLSGVPAALMERAFPATRENNASMVVWFFTAIVISSPGFIRAMFLSAGC